MDKRQRFLSSLDSLSPAQTKAVAQKLFDELVRASERDADNRGKDIAIVGMACRLPGGIASPSQLWRLLIDEKSGIESLDAKNWRRDIFTAEREEKGKLTVTRGGVISGFRCFDHGLFGISKLEAQKMDPHQKHLLEVAWEAFEHAGIQPRALRGSDTAVYVGIMSNDMPHVLIDRVPFENADPYMITGAALSAAAGRISYAFGLNGPAVALDTACSSSLVAIHHAAQSLRLGECEVALAGGITLFLTPTAHIWLSNAQMLAPDGECKAFDSSADGYVRSEGCGLFVLKKLSKAIANGDRIHAVIRGSAINQAGRTQGLTAPNGPSQESVIRRALQAARVKPSEVSYVEAHGTGTSLGDPIEIGALRNVYCTTRDSGDPPLFVGSVKSNIGHCEAAAGAAGLMKVVLSMQGNLIPASLNVKRLNPHLKIADSSLRIARFKSHWPREERKLAGVSSFGFTGSNAHVIVESFDHQPRDRECDLERYFVLKVSAESPTSLIRLCRRYAAFLLGLTPDQLVDACFTINRQRGDYRYGRIFTGSNAIDLAEAIAAYLSHDEREIIERRQGRLWLEISQHSLDDAFFNDALASSKLLRESYAEVLACIADALGQETAPPDASQERSNRFRAITDFARLMALNSYFGELGLRVEHVVARGACPFTVACLAGKLFITEAVNLLNIELRIRDGELQLGDLEAAIRKTNWTMSNVELHVDSATSSASHWELLPHSLRVGNTVAEPNDLQISFSIEENRHDREIRFAASAFRESISALLASYYQWIGTPNFAKLYASGNWCETPLYAFDTLESNELLDQINTSETSAQTQDISDLLEEYWIEATESPRDEACDLNSTLMICDDEEWSSLSADSRCYMLIHGHAPSQCLRNVFRGNLDDEAGIREAFSFVRTVEACNRIVYVPGKHLPVEAVLHRAITLIKEITAVEGQRALAKLFFITTGASAIKEGERVNLAHASLQLLARCFALEHPEQFGGLRDLPIGQHIDLKREVKACVSTSTRELAIRDGRAFAQRIRKVDSELAASIRCSKTDIYLVLGGAGGLGLCAAEALAESGARRLVLTSRSGTVVRLGCAERLQRMRQQGIDVRIEALELADQLALESMLNRLRGAGRLAGIVHAAGISHIAPIIEMSSEDVSEVIEAKVQGAEHLVRLTREDNLDFLLFFSSIAGVWGARGMGAYGVANRHLDALAANERAEGRRAYSVAWGPWAELGMAASSLESAAAAGLLAIHPERGKQLIKAILGGSPRHIVAAKLSLPRFVDLYSSKSDAQLFESLVRQVGVGSGAPLRDELDALPTSERLFAVDEVIARLVRSAINLDDKDISVNDPLHHLGIESLQAVAIRNELSNLSGVKLPHALLFNYTTIRDISSLICERMYGVAA
jgi:3-oxoacyl-(acyl-carrier-protein) synthase/NAD(P)-dependent dehydrogenase (short-subunit alcohol dehydrogenase family)/acyl carrier protein